jgi:hypothetical protein
VPEDDLGSRRTGVADLDEREAQPPPAGRLRRRGRRVAWITATALAAVLAIVLAGLAVRDRVDLDQVAVNPSAGSIPLQLVSDLGPAGWSPPTSRATGARRSCPLFGLWTVARPGNGRRWARRASNRARTEPAR